MAAADSLIGEGLVDSPYAEQKKEADHWRRMYQVLVQVYEDKCRAYDFCYQQLKAYKQDCQNEIDAHQVTIRTLFSVRKELEKLKERYHYESRM